MVRQVEIDFFRNEGYLVVGSILDDVRIGMLKALIDEQLERARSPETRTQWDLMEEAGGQAVFRLSRVMERHEAFQSVATDPLVAEYVRALVGPEAGVCVNRHNMMVVKAPYVGRQIDWHQDGANWGTAAIVSLMVFLEDAAPENGCLEIIPGAHRRGLWQAAASERVGLGLSVEDPEQAALIRQAVPVLCRAGDGVFFHCCLPHFSEANRSGRSRRSFTFAYIVPLDVQPTCPAGMAPVEIVPLPQ